MASVLVVGSGGREHALAWTLGNCPNVDKVYVAPGNGGTEQVYENVPIEPTDIMGLLSFAKEREIDLTVVGPDRPLVNGIVDSFQEERLAIFGPTKAAAQIEGDKIFAKQLMKDNKIPTAKYDVATTPEEAISLSETYLEDGHGAVLKYPYLAEGKGVVICRSKNEIEKAVDDIFVKKKYGHTDKLLIEEMLLGEEVSFMVITDGQNIFPMISSQDHKALNDGDKGPNTGGMGAYAPAPIVTPELEEIIMEKIMKPAVKGMKERETPFKGVLYAGLMISEDSLIPNVLEFNGRFGDPETQVVLSLLLSDLYKTLRRTSSYEGLKDSGLRWKGGYACSIILASVGYPGDYEKGLEIEGMQTIGDHARTFHAGTKWKDGTLVTNGGRVLCVTGYHSELEFAKINALAAINGITFGGELPSYRTDIGDKGIERLKGTKS